MREKLIRWLSEMPLKGPLTVFGLSIALVAFLIDRLSKWWLIDIFGIADRGIVTVLPFFDLVMAWNRGISYGLFQADTALGVTLLASFAIVVTAALTLWLARINHRLMALSIGLIIGGAIGNIYDRIVFGAVADFFSLHAYGYYWYIFNIADIWIAFGVILMIYDSFFPVAEETEAGQSGKK